MLKKTPTYILMCADGHGEMQPVCCASSKRFLDRKLDAFRKAYSNGSRLWDVSNSYIQCVDYFQEVTDHKIRTSETRE